MRLTSKLNYWFKLKWLNIRHKAHIVGNTMLYYMGETSKAQLEQDKKQKIYSMTGKAGKLGIKFNIVITDKGKDNGTQTNSK
jgi:hypothetical protein